MDAMTATQSSTPVKWRPEHGGAYRCLRANKEHGTKKGKIYIYETTFDPQGEICHYNSRWQTRLLGGYNSLRQPGAFETVTICPFCGATMYKPEADANGFFPLAHDAAECAKKTGDSTA